MALWNSKMRIWDKKDGNYWLEHSTQIRTSLYSDSKDPHYQHRNLLTHPSDHKTHSPWQSHLKKITFALNIEPLSCGEPGIKCCEKASRTTSALLSILVPPCLKCCVCACSRPPAELWTLPKFKENVTEKPYKLMPVCRALPQAYMGTRVSFAASTSLFYVLQWSIIALLNMIGNWSSYHFKLFWIISYYYYFTICYYFSDEVGDEKNNINPF